MPQVSDPADIKNSIRVFLLKEFLPGEDPAQLTDDTPLVTGGILDSLATVKLASYVEKEFGVEFAPHELAADYLDSLNLIADLVVSKLS